MIVPEGDAMAFGGTEDLTSVTGDFDKEIRVHDGTVPTGLDNFPEVVCRWDAANSAWRILESISFQYTGDGGNPHANDPLAGSFLFEQVVVTEAGSGSAEDAYAGAVNDGTLTGNTFAGELTVNTSGGITVGDNGADADPNTNTETYDVYAE